MSLIDSKEYPIQLEWGVRVISLCLLCLLATGWSAGSPAAEPAFDISLAAATGKQEITGRLILILTHTDQPEPRFQQAPVYFAQDVVQMKPGEHWQIGAQLSGYPFDTLNDLPSGDYFVQALLNVYTKFHRADQHTLWAHMDQWEGQRMESSPDNFYSEVVTIHWNAAESIATRIALTHVIPPVQVPADSPWVQRIKIRSRLLTRFWGRPIFLGAVVLLPRDYAAHPARRYPVIYQQGHFSLAAPFRFDEAGSDFNEAWRSDGFPQVIAVTFQHPTPFFDDSSAVNSANNGPYDDAIMTELIPYIESHFRIIQKGYARVLTGRSTGGWASLALQLHHPTFFGGAWSFSPDPVDFRRYGLLDIYKDTNAFTLSGTDPSVPAWARPESGAIERVFVRTPEGQPLLSVRGLSRLESIFGSHGRSAAILDSWNAAYAPVNTDGYPKPLFDRSTGKIDPDVSMYMRNQGYDLRDYAEKNWHSLAPNLVAKLHVYCGDMDDFFLDLSVDRLQEFFQRVDAHQQIATFTFGRPAKGHGWQPFTDVELVKIIAAHIARSAPIGSDLAWQH